VLDDSSSFHSSEEERKEKNKRGTSWSERGVKKLESLHPVRLPPSQHWLPCLSLLSFLLFPFLPILLTRSLSQQANGTIRTVSSWNGIIGQLRWFPPSFPSFSPFSSALPSPPSLSCGIRLSSLFTVPSPLLRPLPLCPQSSVCA
jgi:hypothetical protein